MNAFAQRPTLFVDSCFLIALLNPKDDLHESAEQANKKFEDSQFVTTDFILVEVLSFFAGSRPELRAGAARLVEALMGNPNFKVVPATRELFLKGLELFKSRKDKEYSLVDCISFVVMRRDGIQQALTSDHHFEQEDFKSLL
jgi:predicted nucleic acid-binding protein